MFPTRKNAGHALGLVLFAATSSAVGCSSDPASERLGQTTSAVGVQELALLRDLDPVLVGEFITVCMLRVGVRAMAERATG